MKFTANSNVLLSHLQAISRVINTKNTLQILDNFLFELAGNQLTMIATDMETTMITHMEVGEVEGEGKVAVASRLLLETLREFSDQSLTFEINDSNLSMVIKSDNGFYNFIGQNGDEFPRLPEMEEETTQEMILPVETLESGINKTLFSAADDELRPVMNGVYFDILPESLTLVATDAHKLVRYLTNFSELKLSEGTENAGFILPKKPANMLKSVLPKESGDVVVKFDSKNIHFQLANYTLICRQIEGNFPNYNMVIPKSSQFKLIVDRVSLLNALRRVSVFSNQANNLVKLDIQNNQIIVSAQDIDFSISAEETIDCQFNEEDMKIGFKSVFLIEILSNLSSGDIEIGLTDPSRAGIIVPVDSDESGEILMLLMPMLLND